MGAHFALGIVEGADLASYVRAYRGTSIALVARAKASIYDVDLTGPCALVVGSEGAGLAPSLETAAKLRVGIPMPGRMESLNAATAGSLALFECVRQRAGRSR
jgi:TrmH family RNA methyltransferase